MPTAIDRFEAALRENAGEFSVPLDTATIAGLRAYYELLVKWNARLHLVAPCDPEEFATRHVLESLVLLPHIRKGGSVVDVGSGGGLPLIPLLIARPDVKGTLIESSQKKAIFLREALHAVSGRGTVVNERFEDVVPPPVDYVTYRALERLRQKLPVLLDWAPAQSTNLIFGGDAVRKELERIGRAFKLIHIHGSLRRYLLVVEN